LYGLGEVDVHKAIKNYIKAAGKGVLKVMSKMGISTVASYRAAQVFEAIGLGRELVDEYFTGTVSQLGGIGLNEIAHEVALRHRRAYPARPAELAPRDLESGGDVLRVHLEGSAREPRHRDEPHRRQVQHR